MYQVVCTFCIGVGGPCIAIHVIHGFGVWSVGNIVTTQHCKMHPPSPAQVKRCALAFDHAAARCLVLYLVFQLMRWQDTWLTA